MLDKESCKWRCSPIINRRKLQNSEIIDLFAVKNIVEGLKDIYIIMVEGGMVVFTV